MRYYGASYYPEIFPRDEWERDVALMARTGMNVTRLAESAWTYLEPREAVFAFEWLDAPIKRVAAHDVPLPYAPQLEDFVLPQTADIVRAARWLAAY